MKTITRTIIKTVENGMENGVGEEIRSKRSGEVEGIKRRVQGTSGERWKRWRGGRMRK